MITISEPPRIRFATFLMTLESSTNMQRFISGSSLPSGNPAASGASRGTIGQSGKEAEKALGKIFAKMAAAFIRECFNAA
ncbi:hypothetical protein [Mesorhizobium sp. M1396]|uniref:hypothetical protein n=1 Tax=Mesorhizobium sp. M1396 TaxID=2957095 RepID=UPI00333C5A91